MFLLCGAELEVLADLLLQVSVASPLDRTATAGAAGPDEGRAESRALGSVGVLREGETATDEGGKIGGGGGGGGRGREGRSFLPLFL